MDLKNKVVLITGASSGIGRTTAIRFAKEGSQVVINYHENKLGAQETLAEIEKIGGKGIVVCADVSKLKDVKRLFEDILNNFQTVDILINNAGIAIESADFTDISEESILEMLKTNVVGPMLVSQQAIKIMEKQGYGKILNTTSIRGAEHGGRSIVYAASKAALNSFTKTLAKRVAPKIHVNAVAPGFVKTRTYDQMSQEKIDGYIEQTYLKRWITQDEIADAFIFLAKNDGITGQVIYIDGGFLLK